MLHKLKPGAAEEVMMRIPSLLIPSDTICGHALPVDTGLPKLPDGIIRQHMADVEFCTECWRKDIN